MEIAQFITAIGREGRRFAEVAAQAGFETPIETCPAWNTRDLVRHLAEIHLWAAAHVGRRATKGGVDELEELADYWPDLAIFWPSDDDLIDHYLATNSNLVRELEAAPSDLETMTFLPAPSPLHMWARRQAHETAIHRFDIENAADALTGYDSRFAADGIDELLGAMAPRATEFPLESDRAMVVHATDTGDSWRVTMGQDGISTTRDEGPADVSLTGPATDLYVAVWNRGYAATVQVLGDLELLEAWRTNHRVRWPRTRDADEARAAR